MVNYKHWHYDRHRGWQPIKARKLEVLQFIYRMEVVTAHDLMEEFDYIYSSARCRLCQLGKEGFIQPLLMRGQWALTEKGCRKLAYHGVFEREAAERLRAQRQREGKIWFIDGGKIRVAENDGELLVAFTLDDAIRITRELREEGLI